MPDYNAPTRSRMPMVNELMGWDFDFLFMDYGKIEVPRASIMDPLPVSNCL